MAKFSTGDVVEYIGANKKYEETMHIIYEVSYRGKGRFESVSYTHLTLPTNREV